MTEWLDIGPSPPGEPCAQLGTDEYHRRARRECNAYISLLRRTVGIEPAGARLTIRRNEHDFGVYLSVVCEFDDGNQAAVEYAHRCETGGPDEWDAQAKAELQTATSKEVPHGNLD